MNEVLDEALIRKLRALIAADNASDPTIKSLVVRILDGQDAAAAASELEAAAHFHDSFGQNVRCCLILLFGQRTVGALMIRSFRRLGESALDLWPDALNSASALILDDSRYRVDEAAALVTAGLQNGVMSPTPALSAAIVNRLYGDSVDGRPQAKDPNRNIREAFEAICTADRACAFGAIQSALAASESRWTQQGAIAASLWIRHRKPARLEARLVNALLGAFEGIDPLDHRQDETTDALIVALADCVSAWPKTTPARILKKLRVWPWYTAERGAWVFRRAALSVDADASWLPAVLAAISDATFPIEARSHLADALEHVGGKRSEALWPYWRPLLDALACLSSELEERIETPVPYGSRAELLLLSASSNSPSRCWDRL